MTRRMVAQVSLREGVSARARARVAEILSGCAGPGHGIERSHAGIHHPGSVGGGDLTWDLLFEGDAAVDRFCRRAAGGAAVDVLAAAGVVEGELPAWIEAVVAAIPEPLASETTKPGLVGVKRTLWLQILPDAPDDLVSRFEAETPLLAVAVPAIRNWVWSRIRTRSPNPGPTRFTHLWEQEFETLAGLEVDYMSSPFHWGFIDRWFDPEMPEQVVDVRLGHLSCPAREPVLSWGHER